MQILRVVLCGFWSRASFRCVLWMLNSCEFYFFARSKRQFTRGVICNKLGKSFSSISLFGHFRPHTQKSIPGWMVAGCSSFRPAVEITARKRVIPGPKVQSCRV
uniref:(northern house mosquito) hypothetical protein n=1 Tax=Culex pipiens TaxID=7175 RepID=A0A8D8AS77_CULPI